VAEGDGDAVPGAGVVRGVTEGAADPDGAAEDGAGEAPGGGAAVQEASATAVDAAARTGKDL
jgi:hypothetical protein